MKAMDDISAEEDSTLDDSISYHHCLPCLRKDVLALPSVTHRINWISGNVLDTLGCMPL